MGRNRRGWAALLLLLAGCAANREDTLAAYGRALPPGQLGLVPLPAGEAPPDWSVGWQDRRNLQEAVLNSLDYLAAPSSRKFFPYGEISHERMVASLERFLEILQTSRTAEEFRAAVERDFEVWVARGRDNTGDVLFTGYLRPIFPGSLRPDGVYRHPLYGLPEDLVKGEDGAILGRRREDGRVVPYYTRAELASNHHLDGLELVWLRDPFHAYIAQVQGSAIVELPDGRFLEFGYAGKNGHDYVSIGEVLIEEGKIERHELSLLRLIQYFREHPGDLDRVLEKNPSFVFFQPMEGGPYGALGRKVLPYRSLATDKEAFPRAGLAFVELRLPEYDPEGRLVHRPERFFALDQDRGGAIRSAGRCDVFLGTGDERLLARAGQLYARGRMYYLFLRESVLHP